MEHAEDPHLLAATPPVFVDDTGRRRTLTRRAGRVLVVGLAGYLGLLAVGMARDPRLGPLGLPTFALPTLQPDTAPAVLGVTAVPTAAEGTDAGADTGTPSEEQARRAGLPAGGAVAILPTGDSAALSGVEAPTTTTTRRTTTTSAPSQFGGAQPSTTTTTTTTASSTTVTTTGTPGQGSGPVAAKGPDGDGAPGQDRRATTNATGPRR